MTDRHAGEFKLVVPLDASGVEDFEPDQELRVVAEARDGSLTESTVTLGDDGAGAAELAFAEDPGAVRIYVGPARLDAGELVKTETISRTVDPAALAQKGEARLEALKISSYWWHLWPRWCRWVTLRGRVVCPDGKPVPGAKVCAFDVDRFWWWYSRIQVGCDVTDENGEYEITFRWCCGWGPIWWWRTRDWVLDPDLVTLLQPRLPHPIPVLAQPSLEVFSEVLGGEAGQAASLQELNPAAIEHVRTELAGRIQEPPTSLAWLWPWRPWWPWWDCSPDIVFTVTQDCGEGEQVVLDEGFGATRWNVRGTRWDTLTAADACCIDDDPDPRGDCMVMTKVCNTVVDQIGGNEGAAATPAGYRNPNLVSVHGDQPWAGNIPIHGIFGTGSGVDYYEFEYDDGSGFTPMKHVANGTFVRRYFDSTLVGSGTSPFVTVAFPAHDVGGRRVYESRAHYEATNAPAQWGATRWWVLNRDLLINWLTKNHFDDGEYRLRVRAWDLVGTNTLGNDRYLPLCGSQDENHLVLRLDNRMEGDHPTAADHPCGSGTVHGCWKEPDTDFIAVRINGVAVAPCDVIDASAGGKLEIDFLADDPDGHLAQYTLVARYGENQQVPLLGLTGADVAPLPTPAIVPAAIQVGPTYANARTGAGFKGTPAPPRPPASAPTWRGGAMRYTLNNLKLAFPKTCAYQLELRAYKRTIVSCDAGQPYRNLSTYSLTVQV